MKATSEISSDQVYSSGNLRKYQSSNPLKRLFVSRMQKLIVELAVGCCGCSGTVRILDAGCGEGINAALLEKHLPGARIVLFDASEKALAYARGLCSKKCSIQCGSILELPFPADVFDLVLCTEVLEHIEQPSAALSELLRVASGSVLISVPCEPWFQAGNLLSLHHVKRLGDPPDHVNHWTSKGFQHWIIQHSDGWKATFYHSFPWSLTVLHRTEPV